MRGADGASVACDAGKFRARFSRTVLPGSAPTPTWKRRQTSTPMLNFANVSGGARRGGTPEATALLVVHAGAHVIAGFAGRLTW